MITAPPGMLPAPRIPAVLHNAINAIPAGLDPDLDTYRDRARTIIGETRDALDALDTNRPGGQAWQAARASDQAAVTAGTPPKTWATAELLRTDPDRWAAANALASTVAARLDTTCAAIPTTTAARLTRHIETLTEERRPHLEAAWDAARQGQRGQAIIALDEADRHSTRIADAQAILYWLNDPDRRADTAPNRPGTGPRWIGPNARRDYGLHWCSAMLADPERPGTGHPLGGGPPADAQLPDNLPPGFWQATKDTSARGIRHATGQEPPARR